MIILRALLFFVLAGLAVGRRLSVQPREARIVGGNEVTPFEYPWIAALFYNGRFICAGSLVSPGHVLTAAHCTVPHVPSRLMVEVRRHDLSVAYHNEGSFRRSVSRLFVHPDYHGPTLRNDVAVWKLDSPVNGVSLVPLTDSVEDLVDGEEVLAMGWGAVGYGLPASNKLLEVTMAAIDFSLCNLLWDSILDPDAQICAGFDAGGKDTCQGDSGGPLLAGNGTELALVGIVSFGYQCALPGVPGVYTNVRGVRSFIDASVNKNASDSCTPNPCNDGRCYEHPEGFGCYCHAGYHGDLCESSRSARATPDRVTWGLLIGAVTWTLWR